jgi:hypothetical protein
MTMRAINIPVAGPGETVYDKVGTAKRPISQERILYKDGDNWVPLKDYDGDVIDSPNIYTNELIKANREFSAVYDASHYVISNRHASSAKELGERLQKLKEENQLPVVRALVKRHLASSLVCNQPGAEVVGM